MDRLTERDPYWLGEEFWTSAREPDEEEIDAVYERLKSYEDTGLTPEQIMEMKEQINHYNGMGKEFTKPLTPKFRGEINISINNQIEELKTCQSNAIVNTQLIGLKAFKNLINNLPDGYLIPMRKD